MLDEKKLNTWLVTVFNTLPAFEMWHSAVYPVIVNASSLQLPCSYLILFWCHVKFAWVPFIEICDRFFFFCFQKIFQSNCNCCAQALTELKLDGILDSVRHAHCGSPTLELHYTQEDSLATTQIFQSIPISTAKHSFPATNTKTYF